MRGLPGPGRPGEPAPRPRAFRTPRDPRPAAAARPQPTSPIADRGSSNHHRKERSMNGYGYGLESDELFESDESDEAYDESDEAVRKGRPARINPGRTG